MNRGQRVKGKDCGVITATAMAIPGRYVGKSMANLPIGYHEDRQKQKLIRLNQKNSEKNGNIEKIENPIQFSKEQVEHLYRLLNQASISSHSLSPNLGSCSVAQFGNYHTALKSSVKSKEPWIIDSGACDHMTSCYNLFYSFVPCSSNTTIKIAYGSLSSIAGVGTVRILKDLDLKYVLHVPALKCNLISVSKITQDNNCVAKFLSSSRLF